MSNYNRFEAKMNAVKKDKSKPYKIPVMSAKRKANQKDYVTIVKEMLSINPNCDIKQDGCQIKATGLHHQKKRSPATFLDKRYLIRACDSCNSWAELYPLQAIEKGISLSKFSK